MKRMQRVFGDIDALRFVDGRLEEERRADFLAHLQDVPEDAERIEIWSRQNEVLRAAFGAASHEPVPIWLRPSNLVPERAASLVGKDTAPLPLHVDPAQKPPIEAPLRPGTRTSRSSAITAAAVAVIAAGCLTLVATRVMVPLGEMAAEPRPLASDDPARSFLARAVDAYRTYATDPVHPVEIASTQQTQLEHWLQRRLSVPIHAPDLRQEGWSLLGGRLAPGDIGPGAFLVYENEANERLGLYIARSIVAPKSGAIFETMTHGSAMSWVAGPVGFAVTVGKDLPWLTANAEILRARVEPAVIN